MGIMSEYYYLEVQAVRPLQWRRSEEHIPFDPPRRLNATAPIRYLALTSVDEKTALANRETEIYTTEMATTAGHVAVTIQEREPSDPPHRARSGRFDTLPRR